jgi:hypothetical protein
MEDDYIPGHINFDSVLVDILEKKKCEYLCTLVSNTTWNNNGIVHAGVTNGICKTTALETIWQKYNSLLLGDDASIVNCKYYWYGQLLFSYPYHHCGFKIDDFSDEYCVPFWYAQQGKIKFFVKNPSILLVPIQYWRTYKGPI